MKFTLTLAILASLVAALVARDVEQIIKNVNQKQSSWVAGHNKFSSMSNEEIKSMLGLRDTRATDEQFNLADSVYEKPQYKLGDNDLPTNFDGRKVWGECQHPVRNQAHCGSCWAFGAAETLGTRFCIHSNGTRTHRLAPQDLVSCSMLNFGCNGGNLALAWAYMRFSGVVSDDCLPYVSGDGHVPSCPRTCTGGGEYSGKSLKSDKHYARSFYPLWVDLPSRRINDMKKDIVENGPIEAGFTVYEDFMQYKSGVYRHTTGGVLGGHAVSIAGFGVDSSTQEPYWLVRNSWGTEWGEDGYFRIITSEGASSSSETCGMEAGSWAGMPNLD